MHRNKSIKIRVSDAELHELTVKAAGVPTARFMREYCLNGDVNLSSRRPPKVDPDFLKVFIGVGNNLNQLTRYAHQQNHAAAVDVASLAFALSSLNDTLEKLYSHVSNLS